MVARVARHEEWGLTPYILLNLKDNFKHSLGIALARVVPFLIIFLWIFDWLLPTAKDNETMPSSGVAAPMPPS